MSNIMLEKKGKKALDLYLAEIGRIPLLSSDEERRLAVRWKENQELAAAQRLAVSNLRFVVKVANEYRRYGIRMADLIQEGNVGLLMAIQRYEPERGFRLISYAVWWIRAQIQNFILRNWRLVKLGTTQAQRKLFYGLERTRRRLRMMGGEGEAPERAMIARELGIAEEVVEEMQQRLSGNELSLDAEVDAADGRNLLDVLDDGAPSQEEMMLHLDSQRHARSRIDQAMEKLSDRERHIVSNRSLAEQPKTLQVLGSELGVTRERVRQLEARAMRKLSRALHRDEQLTVEQRCA